MGFDPNRHHRRSIRLKGYDYSQAGAYFLTICTHKRNCIFGKVTDFEMHLNDTGRTAEQCWFAIPHHFPHVDLDAFVIMPNHIHGIIVITTNVGAENLPPPPAASPTSVRAENISHVRAKNISPPQPKSIGSIVRGFKIGVTKWCRANTNIHVVWQRNYFEHIIRNDRSLDHIRQYILNNPAQWHLDRENPEATQSEPEDEWRI